jgi:hypothetical protein
MQPYAGRRRRRWPWIVLVGLLAVAGWVILEPGRGEPPPEGPDPRTMEGLVEIAQAGPEVPGSLAAYWKPRLSDADPPVALQRPRGFVPYQLDALPETNCTLDRGTARNNAFYCPVRGDHRIYWDSDWFDELNRVFGPTAPLSVLAHEYGHHLSYLLGEGGAGRAHFSKQEELEADCLSGMYLRYANKQLHLSNRELILEAYDLFKSADPASDAPWFASGRHGSGKERLGAFGNGFFLASLPQCQKYEHLHGNLVVDVGGYPMALAPGVKADRIDDNRVRVRTTTGQTVDVVYLNAEEGEPPAAVFEHFRDTMFGDEVRLRLLGPPDEAPHAYGTQVSQSYGMAFVRDGQRQLFHGEAEAVVLKEGGAIGFDAFEPGPARGADPSSWDELERVLTELQVGIWPDQEGG